MQKVAINQRCIGTFGATFKRYQVEICLNYDKIEVTVQWSR